MLRRSVSDFYRRRSFCLFFNSAIGIWRQRHWDFKTEGTHSAENPGKNGILTITLYIYIRYIYIIYIYLNIYIYYKRDIPKWVESPSCGNFQGDDHGILGSCKAKDAAACSNQENSGCFYWHPGWFMIFVRCYTILFFLKNPYIYIYIHIYIYTHIYIFIQNEFFGCSKISCVPLCIGDDHNPWTGNPVLDQPELSGMTLGGLNTAQVGTCQIEKNKRLQMQVVFSLASTGTVFLCV